jgi:crotonobetainyl-CoA:carnitine CoA-transferase CaiB-like acyl-CoA transferase
LPDGRRAKLPRLPVAMGGRRFDLRLEAPGLGQHTRPLLEALGYKQAQIDALHQAEVVVAPGNR